MSNFEENNVIAHWGRDKYLTQIYIGKKIKYGNIFNFYKIMKVYLPANDIHE